MVITLTENNLILTILMVKKTTIGLLTLRLLLLLKTVGIRRCIPETNQVSLVFLGKECGMVLGLRKIGIGRLLGAMRMVNYRRRNSQFINLEKTKLNKWQ
jgi:hypothetical protein